MSHLESCFDMSENVEDSSSYLYDMVDPCSSLFDSRSSVTVKIYM